MSNLTKILTAGALALSLAGTASAATLTINGGTAGTVPGGVKNGNNALIPLGLAPSAFGPYEGFYGAQIGLTTNTKAKIKYTLLGWEASYINTFTSDGDSFGSDGTGKKVGIWNAAGLASFVNTTLPGLLGFTFETDGGSGPTLSVSNGTNTVPTKNKVNFFASVVGDPTATEGNSLYLFFDDDGNTQDDNHDDLVVRVDVAAVPVPAAGFMLFGALGGLAAVRRRRKAA